MENETKLRRTHFTIQLRRENNEESFHKARRQMINTRDKIEVENSAVISEMFSQNMMRLKQAENIQELMAALISTRSLMSATNDVGQVPVREFLASGLLDPVMALARGDPSFPERDREVTQVEALWIVSNLVLCPVEFYPKLLALGLLEMIDETLGSDDPNILKDHLESSGRRRFDFCSVREKRDFSARCAGDRAVHGLLHNREVRSSDAIERFESSRFPTPGARKEIRLPRLRDHPKVQRSRDNERGSLDSQLLHRSAG